MGTISVSLPSDGTNADVADVNTPITTIVNEINGQLDNSNIKAAAGISTSKLAADNGITAGMISSGAITLGYTQITSSFSTTSTTPVQVTGLSVTVTIPAGGRRIKVTAFMKSLYNSTNGSRAEVSIWDGAVGSGTKISEAYGASANVAAVNNVTCIAVITPSAGTKTYNVGLLSNPSGTATIEAATNAPAFILVEAI